MHCMQKRLQGFSYNTHKICGDAIKLMHSAHHPIHSSLTCQSIFRSRQKIPSSGRSSWAGSDSPGICSQSPSTAQLKQNKTKCGCSRSNHCLLFAAAVRFHVSSDSPANFYKLNYGSGDDELEAHFLALFLHERSVHSALGMTLLSLFSCALRGPLLTGTVEE